MVPARTRFNTSQVTNKWHVMAWFLFEHALRGLFLAAVLALYLTGCL